MGVSSICRFRLFLGTELLCNIPCVLVNDSFVRIGKYHQLISGGSSALLRLEVFADGFTQHGMTEIFLPVKDISHGGCTPTIGVYHFLVSAILRRSLGGISSRYQNLIRSQHFRYGGCSDALASQTEYSSDYLGGRFIHKKLLFIVLGTLVAVGDGATASQAFLHSGLEYCFDFVACIFRIPLVHDVEERGKVIVCGIGAVNAVVDSDKSYSLFREQDFGVVADLQIITTKTTEVFYHKGLNMTCFNFFKQGCESGTVEIRAGIAVIRKVPDISQPFLSGVFFEIHFLILDRVRFASLLIVSGQSLIQSCNFDFFVFCHGFNLPSLCNFGFGFM